MNIEGPRKRIAYYFDDEVGVYTFNKGHPMRPFRMKITDELLNHMQCYDADFFDLPSGIMTQYHSDEYIDLLKNINEDNFKLYQDHVTRFGFSGDCPCPQDSKFYDFCELYTKGTGNFTDVGYEKGIYRSVNFPFEEGVDDNMYFEVFKKVIDRIFEVFNPEAVVHQCGADSLSGDKLGCFNLSVKGHGRCLDYVKNKGKPVIALGGGGYTLRNIPRCWTYETSLLVGTEIEDRIPENEYIGYFKPEKRLHLPISNMENQNTWEDLHNVMEIVDTNIKNIQRISNDVRVEGKSEEYNMLWDNNGIRQEIEEEKSENHRNYNNIIGK